MQLMHPRRKRELPWKHPPPVPRQVSLAQISLRITTQRPEVLLQAQNRPTALRDMCVKVTLLAPILAAKQLALTYYRQRDGIVKSIGSFYPPPRGVTSGLHDQRKER